MDTKRRSLCVIYLLIRKSECRTFSYGPQKQTKCRNLSPGYTRCNIVRRTRPNVVIRTLPTMLDTHITLLETRHFSHHYHLPHFGLLMVLGLETGTLTLIGVCHKTLLNVAENACLIEIKTSNQNIQAKNVEQT